MNTARLAVVALVSTGLGNIYTTPQQGRSLEGNCHPHHVGLQV